MMRNPTINPSEFCGPVITVAILVITSATNALFEDRLFIRSPLHFRLDQSSNEIVMSPGGTNPSSTEKNLEYAMQTVSNIVIEDERITTGPRMSL